MGAGAIGKEQELDFNFSAPVNNKQRAELWAKWMREERGEPARLSTTNDGIGGITRHSESAHI